MTVRGIGLVALGAVCIASVPLRCRADDAVWSVAGRQVLRLHATAGGMTPQERVEALDERLTNILSEGEARLGAEDIALKTLGGEVVITVRNRLLVTVTRQDAEANSTTPQELGRRWLVNLRNTLPLLAPRLNKHGA
ncbi:MAG: hypothetical protein ACP5VE_15160 [Chthonomonadales bacterium]